MSEEHLLIFLLQVLLLLALARGVGELLRHWGHPPLVGEILVGVLLGPTSLGRLLPELQASIFPDDAVQQSMLQTVSWFGVLFLLLETGLEVNVSAAWRQRGPALRIGIIGVLVPLVIGFVPSLFLPDRYLAEPDQRLIFALFLGTTMAISAMVIIARVLHDLDLVKSDLGLVTLCGYAVNDILAWVIFSLVLSMATQAVFDLGPFLLAIVFSVVFTAACLTFGPRMTDRAIAFIDRQLPQQPGAVLTAVCCLGLACGAATAWAGLTALFGFFLAGIMAGEAHALSERTRQIISQMVHAIFVPLYFAGIGLHLDFLANFDWFIVLFVTVLSIGGKFLGAWIGALGSGLSREERLSVAIAFTPSGVTGIVVAGVAFEYGVLTISVFVAIIVSAVVSSLAVGPWLTWSIRRRGEVDLLELFARRGVIAVFSGSTRQQVIGELCVAAAEEEGMPSARELTAAVIAREELMGTAVGNRTAVPHARLSHIGKPVLVFGRSPSGVEWDAPDGRAVRLVFLVLSSADDDWQLQILAAIARGMSAATREQLAGAPGEAELWEVLRGALGAEKLSQGRAAGAG